MTKHRNPTFELSLTLADGTLPAWGRQQVELEAI